MSDSHHTGPINSFGDLSRRARRELEAKGIDPEAALAQYRETGDVQALTGAIPIIQPEPSVPTESAQTEQPSSSPSLFPASFSRRDETIIEQRITAENAIIADTHPQDAQEASEASGGQVPATEAEMDELIAIVERDTNVVPDSGLASSQDVEPVVFDGGPLAEVENVIAIDRSDDTESTISEYEAFQITTTSTGVIPTTGHTLILPTLPEEDPTVIASLNQTGEIVITGQITLPAIPSSPANPTSQLDTNDLDLQSEPELVTSSQDLAPVSAAQAVSSSAGPTSAVAPVRRRSEKLPLILAISAAVLAVAVVALFVANMFIPVFQ